MPPAATPPAATPRVHVVSFGTAEYAGSLCVLRTSALGVGGADTVTLFGPDDVQLPPELLADSKGHGWWAWKPLVIQRVLRRVPDGDVVVYVDAAASFVSSVRDYAARARKDVTLFRLGECTVKDHSIGSWTHPAALAALADGLGVPATPLRWHAMANAAVQMYRAGWAARAFVDEYAAWCLRREVVGDAADLPDHPHRHDQSVLSVLAWARGVDVDMWRDPTQFGAKDPLLGPQLPTLLRHHRQRLPLPPKVAVVTPSVGGTHLRACMQSVQAQTYPNIEHWVFADGPAHHRAVRDVAQAFEGRVPVQVVDLPRNTGAGGWNGHRVYAAAPWLLDAPLVAFLDDDNELDPDHINSLVEALRSNAEAVWAYSLRTIIDEASAVVCVDNCESLGALTHTCLAPGDYLIDTSCYLLPRELACDLSASWNAPFRGAARAGRLETDRALATALIASVPGACTRQPSVRYRVGSTARSVGADFFLANNTGWDFARKRDAYVFHFGPRQTAEYFAKRLRRDRSYAFDEWQMTLWRGLEPTHNLLNGFTNMAHIPRGATCLVSLCHPQELPLDFFTTRTDLVTVCYTLESPNIRHQAQWDAAWLARHFTRLLTYWTPLLRDARVQATYCPHNTHHLDLTDDLDRAQLRANRGTGRSVCMVLERRDLAGSFVINGVELQCLDRLREVFVDGLEDVTVYGQGWDASRAVQGGRARLGHALHRSQDPRSNVDIMQDYVFNVIVENSSAEGYASEKLYDCLVAGCIPLYYGSAPAFVPPGLYLDLKQFRNGAEVQAHLAALSDTEVAAWRQRVLDQREHVLRQVSTHAFADAVRAALGPEK